MFKNINRALYKAREVFKDIMPNPVSILTGRNQKIIKIILKAKYYNSFLKKVNNNSISEIAGAMLAGAVIDSYKSKMKSLVLSGFNMTKKEEKYIPLNERHLFFSKRTWFTKTGKQKLVLIYHEATHKHVDIHFENGTSLIIRVSGKPVESEIKFNKDGILTEKSKTALISHIKAEIANNSRVPQNYDHDHDEARMSWYKGDIDGPESGTYGSGLTRQVISIEDIEVLKIYDGPGQNVEIYAPSLNSNHLVYIHKLYPGDEKTAPITIFGSMTSTIEDKFGKLHLKYEKDLELYKSLIDPSTNTEKIDGSASAIHIGPKSTRVFSHRTSKETNKPIEYTGKLGDLIQLKGNIDAYGEIVFEEKNIFGQWNRLPSAKISGILNSNKVLPDNIKPKLYLYRIDKYNGEVVSNLGFWENRKIQEEIIKLHPTLDIVPLAKIEEKKDIEGYVGVPFGKSINDGIKFKFADENQDLIIKEVNFEIGPTGKAIAGVLICEDDKTGLLYNMGSGQMGNHKFCKEIMEHPNDFIGKVFVTNGLRGTAGRALKFDHWHDDKGND